MSRWRLRTWHQSEIEDAEGRKMAEARGVNTAEEIVKAHNATVPRPTEEWHEDIGDVLWWSFPVVEAPYCGTPLDDSWPVGFNPTHWTPIPIPEEPK